GHVAGACDVHLEPAANVAHGRVAGAGHPDLGRARRARAGVARARLADPHVAFDVAHGPIAAAGVAELHVGRAAHRAPDRAAGVEVDVARGVDHHLRHLAPADVAHPADLHGHVLATAAAIADLMPQPTVDDG